MTLTYTQSGWTEIFWMRLSSMHVLYWTDLSKVDTMQVKQVESLSVCLYQEPLGTALFTDNATNFRPSSRFLLFFSISQGMVEFETGVWLDSNVRFQLQPVSFYV